MPRCTPSPWTSAGLQEDTTCLSSIPVYNKIRWVIQTGYPKAIFSMSTRKQHMNWAEFPLKMTYATISHCLLLFSVLPSQKLVLYRPVPAKHSRVMRNLGGIEGAFQEKKHMCGEERGRLLSSQITGLHNGLSNCMASWLGHGPEPAISLSAG